LNLLREQESDRKEAVVAYFKTLVD